MAAERVSEPSSSYQISYIPEDAFMYVEYFGDMKLKSLIDSFSELIRHKNFQKNMAACYDFSNAVMDIDMPSTEVIYHFVEGLGSKRGDDYQLAFVCSDEMTKALCNFYRLFYSRKKIDVETFKNKATAIEWIKESSKPATVSYIS